MAGCYLLQPPIIVTSDQEQGLFDAADIMPYGNVTVKITVLSGALGGTVEIIQAMTNSAGAYDASNVSRTLTSVGRNSYTLQLPERFVRWRVTSLNGTATFMIELLGREH